MKRKIKVFGIIALIAVIGLMMTNCDLFGKRVRSKFLFSGNPNSSGRSAFSGSQAARGVEGGIEGVDELEKLYPKLGTLIRINNPCKAGTCGC
jgi:hypothetical protein